jgi:hypothetical protein
MPTRFSDAYFTIPPEVDDGPTPAAVALNLAGSLEGAIRGEIVLLERAPATPRSQTEIAIRGAKFRRITVRHTWRADYGNHEEQLEVWQRV